MKTHNLKPAYTSSSYRFKSWSRKSYAVFNSLRLIVNIGVLRFDICERLAAKTTKCFTIQAFNPFDAGENSIEEDEVKLNWCVQILTLMPGFVFLLALISNLKENSGDSSPRPLPHSVDSHIPFYNPPSLTLLKFSFTAFPVHSVQISTYTKPFYINSFNLKPNERDEKNYHDDHVVCIQHCRI